MSGMPIGAHRPCSTSAQGGRASRRPRPVRADHRPTTGPTLLERGWPSVIAVAQIVYRDGEARHDDVCKALGVDDGGGPGSTQLANLRVSSQYDPLAGWRR